MNRFTLIVCCAALACASAALAEEPPRTISVTGTAERHVTPDRAVWNISCTDEDLSLQDAKARNDEKMNNIMALAKELEVAPGDLQAGSMNIRRNYEHDERGRNPVFKGFRVSREVRITQHDLSRLDEYLQKLVGAGDIEVNLNMESSEMHEQRWENRLEAMKLAKKKAEAMLEVVGAQLGPVLTVDEHAEGSRPWQVSNSLMSNGSIGIRVSEGDAMSGTFAPGALQIMTTVYVTFKIE